MSDNKVENLERVSIIGSGNWLEKLESILIFKRGSAIAKIIGYNTGRRPLFEAEVRMWVFEETFEGRKLSEIINEDHENKK